MKVPTFSSEAPMLMFEDLVSLALLIRLTSMKLLILAGFSECPM